MTYWLAANTLVLLHLLFICFVVLGGLLVLRWRWIVYLHIPAAIWGALIEFNGWICPLTPIEKQLREAGGESGYSGGFVEHYILPIIYPHGLTQEIQWILGGFVVMINGLIYAVLLKRNKLRR